MKLKIKITQEEKQLLLIDICGRLPYSTKVFYEYVDDLDKKTYGYSLTLNTWCIDELIAEKAIVKPYLRPMSSMTEEESIEWFNYHHEIELEEVKSSGDYLKAATLGEAASIDWLNKNHFDYRGLIPMGLAIEVNENNNPYKD